MALNQIEGEKAIIHRLLVRNIIVCKVSRKLYDFVGLIHLCKKEKEKKYLNKTVEMFQLFLKNHQNDNFKRTEKKNFFSMCKNLHIFH